MLDLFCYLRFFSDTLKELLWLFLTQSWRCLYILGLSTYVHWFCTLISCQTLLSTNILFVEFLGSPVSSVYRDSLIFLFPIWIPLISFPCPRLLFRTSNTMLNCWKWISLSSSTLSEKVSSLPPFSVVLLLLGSLLGLCVELSFYAYLV